MANSNEKSTIAVIAVGGKQHLVRLGNTIRVNRLGSEAGQTLEEKDLLTDTPVTLEVINHQLGSKINGLKFHRKVRYTRRYGHRQQLTELKVLAIGNAKPAQISTPKNYTSTKETASVAPKAKKITSKPAKKSTTKKVIKDGK
jgi:large subunit ribosomal protein L21